jgi:hypothetical protein
MRLWLEYLSVGVLVWISSQPGMHPALRLVVMTGALVWSAVTATRPSRVP